MQGPVKAQLLPLPRLEYRSETNEVNLWRISTAGDWAVSVLYRENKPELCERKKRTTESDYIYMKSRPEEEVTWM